MDDKTNKSSTQELVGDNEDFIFLEADNKPHSER